MPDRHRPNRAARFVRSSYWGTWSLVLTERFRLGMPSSTGWTVEIDLSPVNGWDRAGEHGRKVEALNVRVHCTARGKDLLTDELPEDVARAFALHAGADVAAWLLDPATEILGIVDWAEHRRISNGGASLRACVKPAFAHLVPPHPIDAERALNHAIDAEDARMLDAEDAHRDHAADQAAWLATQPCGVQDHRLAA